MHVSLKRTVLWAAAILMIWGGAALGQQSLKDLSSEMGVAWIAGQWTATTNDGQTVDLAYRWGLEGYLVNMDFKMGEYAYKAMIFYDADEDKVVEVGVDSRGGLGKGSWDIEGEDLVSTASRRDAEGRTQKMAIVHKKGARRTMTVEIYSVDEYGNHTAEPWGTMEFKRKVVKRGDAARKAKGKAEDTSN